MRQPISRSSGCATWSPCLTSRRLASADDEPRTTADVTSVGIDMGSKLSSWKTRLVDIFWFELNDSGNERPFLVTAKIPEHGRSGGGLFDADGTLVGVCVGHAEMVQGRRMGVFSSKAFESCFKHTTSRWSSVDRKPATLGSAEISLPRDVT